VLRRIAGASYIDKALIKTVIRDVQRALLQSDMNVKLVFEVTSRLEDRALSEKPPPGMSGREHVIKIIYEELVNILGETREIPLKSQRILLLGLYGCGKTTTCGKLVKYFQKRGLNVALIAADTHRPAAYDQLEQIGRSLNVSVYGDRNETRAVKIAREGIRMFENYDVLIVDSSGRHALEPALIEEIKRVSNVVQPDETILVIDATIGQEAYRQAKAFHDAVGVSGVIITKLDGTAKGGGALSAVAATGAPILFIGTGEHLDDLEKFDPPRFISRLLGMGDIQALLEKAEEYISEEAAEETAKKILAGKFTLKDLCTHLEAITKMGSMKKIFSMIPWLSDKLSSAEIDLSEQKLKTFRIIMDSMTDEELENPRIIKASRIHRIARGSGVPPAEIRDLLKRYNLARKSIRGLTSNRKIRRQLMKQFGKGFVQSLPLE
jgi:signal recognition particle subunit SRP54